MEIVDTLVGAEAFGGKVGRYKEHICRIGLAVITLFAETNQIAN